VPSPYLSDSPQWQASSPRHRPPLPLLSVLVVVPIRHTELTTAVNLPVTIRWHVENLRLGLLSTAVFYLAQLVQACRSRIISIDHGSNMYMTYPLAFTPFTAFIQQPSQTLTSPAIPNLGSGICRLEHA
jgi:hypothetical protein